MKPGPRELAIERNRIDIVRFEIDSIENVFFVAFRMEHLQFRRIKETAGVEPVGGNKVPPLGAPDAEIKPEVASLE